MKKMKKSRRVQVMRQRNQPEQERGVLIPTFADADKFIVIVETPPTAAKFIQVTCLMNDEDLAQAKKERPDLVFRIPDHMVIEHALQEEPVGESLRGMTIPAEDQERWMKDLGLEGLKD